jgi:hypothetical protein
MMKVLKIIVITGAAIFVIIQFFQPAKNESGLEENHILKMEKIPVNVAVMLENSCFDCHSDHTRYPWYDKIAPASWLVAHHIKEGKSKLNFSGWAKLDTLDKISSLVNIQEELKSGGMPLPAYSFIHRKAQLSEDQIKEMIQWTDNLSGQLMNDESNK